IRWSWEEEGGIRWSWKEEGVGALVCLRTVLFNLQETGIIVYAIICASPVKESWKKSNKLLLM
ncbi:MAG: hypothetical protein ACK559_11100, partial [bacterium]